MNTRSIRFRLAAWHAAVLTAVFVLLGAVLFLQLRSYLESTLLDSQVRRARQIAATLLAKVTRTGEPYIAASVESLYAPEVSGRFIRIARQDGTPLYLSGPPADHSFDPRRVPFREPWPKVESGKKLAIPGGEALLVAAVRAGAAGASSYLVEVGISAQPVDELLRRTALLFGLVLPFFVAVAAVGGYVLVRRALRPVEEIAGKAELITQHNLDERLPVARTGDELERLAVSLNRMITRLQDAFDNSKRFVADASHELRTPLTVVRGELESLAHDGRFALVPDLADRLGSLLEEVERLSKVVERLLALSRLDAGEAQSEWVRFDLAAMAVDTAEQMALLAEDKQIALEAQAAEPVEVEGDRARLKEIVVNLLDNAIKYTPDGGKVRLTVSAQGGAATLEVADTGVGIPPEALPRVFDRFFRAADSRRPTVEGAGLGLAIVKSICKAHGGEAEVESEIGRGSRFRVKLPQGRRIQTRQLT